VLVARPLPRLSRRRRLPRIRLRVAFVVVVLGAYLVAAIFGTAVAPHDPNAVGTALPLAGGSADHLLGTDDVGRDLLSRLISAARVGILAAVESVAIAVGAGCTLGVLAAYLGGKLDWLVLRFADFLFSFPEFLLGIVVIAALGPGLWHATLAIGIVYTPRFIRVARVQAVSVMRSSYVEAARLARRSGAWIMLRHVLPNISTPVVILVALSMSTAQLTYASLSFLGFGARPPQADYGQMLAAARTYMIQDPRLVIAPAVALALLVLAFNLLGDVVRDRLDPRSAKHTSEGRA
jgi:ABC-type dipeptide/oligopeptide/nickel transport system permease subunit